ncbi:MAG: toll/interleukin-1 receptor domain-containing protein [candidate division NC10 bacterium]|nr:toll/interleukin-1 receptor domain-containing protein [candidate division NC10 bacterium]
MTKKIFLSYSMQDAGKIELVVKKLRRHQSSVGKELAIVDPSTQISPGDDVRRTIRSSIEESDAVVVVWTPASASSSWVNYEAGMAEALGKQIIVVRSGRRAPTLPVNLQSAQVLELRDKPKHRPVLKGNLEVKSRLKGRPRGRLKGKPTKS